MGTFADDAKAPPGTVLRLAHHVVALNSGEPSGDAAGCFDTSGTEVQGLFAVGAAEPPERPLLLAIIDGLGHGPLAAAAAQAALDTLAAQPDLPLAELFSRLDARLASTRGAAIGLVQLQGLQMRHAGIGNTRAVCLRGREQTRLPSQNGIVGGGQALCVSINERQLQRGDWLLLFTDGINEHLQLPVQLPEWERSPDILCQHVLARWRAAADDAGVLVMHVGAA